MSQDEYFQFVKALAVELNRKEIELTSFPDVVIRVRKALDDPDVTPAQLGKVLSVDPVLASRILVLANSSHYNRGSLKIDGLDAAVGRIGFDTVRKTAISYAVEQLHAAQGAKALKKELSQAWSGSLRLAAMSEVIAQAHGELDGDSAFIAGLLNQIGVLYIFSKYDDYPGLLQDEESRHNLIEEWVAPISESIVSNWKFSKAIQGSVNPDDDEASRRGTKANLADVVQVAKAALNGAAETSCDSPAAQRLGLGDDQLPAIMSAYKEKLESLASAVR